VGLSWNPGRTGDGKRGLTLKKSDSLEIKEKYKHENPKNCEPF
jgi:hypothetical protein